MIRVTVDSDNGQNIVFDEKNKLRIFITNKVVKYANKDLTVENVKKFYKTHKEIAKENKEENENEFGYFNTSITIKDFFTRGVENKLINKYLRIPFCVVESYEKSKNVELSDEDFKNIFEFTMKIYKNKLKNKKEFKKLDINIKIEELSDNKINELITKDIKMGEEVMVQGTPTIFVNKVKDSTRQKYETLGKK